MYLVFLPIREMLLSFMHVISQKALKDHWQKPGRKDSEGPLKAWHRYARHAAWKSPANIKADFHSVSFVGDRVVFNIAGNKYRLVVRASYPYQRLYVRFVGTHAEYDKIDVRNI